MSIFRTLKLSKNGHIFLFGPRQVGKSTLIKDSFPNTKTIFYNLLNFSEFSRLQNNPELLIEDLRIRKPQIKYVVIDEIQKLPALLDQVHHIIEDIENPPFFILTGSSARKLKRGQANLLGGRALNFNLAPFTYEELINAQTEKKTVFSLKKALEIGTLPNIYLEQDSLTAKQRLESYVEVYLKEEIKEEALVRNLGSFIEFLRFAAEENSNPLNFSKIASDIGVSAVTVKEYFSILEDTLIAFFLRPYSRTVRKKVTKTPKFYFFDTGVKRALARETSMELIPKTKEFGKAFEHYFIKELINISKYKDRNYDFSYYRTESGAEVDLIVTTPKKDIYAIEIKSSISPKASELKGLKSFQAVCPQAKLCCASLSPKKYQLHDITIYPWEEILLLV